MGALEPLPLLKGTADNHQDNTEDDEERNQSCEGHLRAVAGDVGDESSNG